MIACVVIPGFELRAALRAAPGLAERPAALAPLPGTEPLLGAVTAAADAAGVRPGMRLGEALATCPGLVLVEQDPATARDEWEGVLRRLEDAGFAVDSADLGCVYFETRGVERLYGGLEAALKRALAAVGSAWDPRVGAAERRFAALAAANVARPGQVLIVSDERTGEFLAPLPLSLLPLPPERYAELEQLGVRKLGQLAGLPGSAVAERLGPDGRRAWGLARGGRAGRVRGRRPPAELVESLEFPEAVGNELTLRRAFGALLDRVLARPERDGRFARKVAVAARLVGGGSWRRTVTLRDPTADRDRLKAALAPKLAELPAPVLELRLELVSLTESRGQQLELVCAEGDGLQMQLQEGLKQVCASTGSGSVCSVVEVAPWSRIPEARALLLPRDD
ncbi:MAG: protein ImuB [Gaiellaceae bacterium]|nr:protein ImuB [Gaiellaceae bacterium]MDX6487524.1 protein ImuB [Gaiellaceae bacterium]MDX6510041.1 protein ImuB [Gaiellaceae bacterium]MDX6543357.1 protein ImuB [Gaiellaceae bacterium]